MDKLCSITTALIAGSVLAITCPGEESGEQEVFELSPFEVSTSGDRGYMSTNAISGTSLNQLIRDLPMPLEVINRELVDDLQATDLEEALEYSAGVYMESYQDWSGANYVNPDFGANFYDSAPSATGLNNEFTNTISLRGYTVPNSQRFGFRVGAIVPAYNVVLGGSTDMITTERIEVVRGPQALLYGINVLSGVVNIIPKEPLFDPAYETNLSVGNYGYRRLGIDATGPIIPDRLAYRLLGAYTEEGSWTMFEETEREEYALQMKWRITPRYNVFVEVRQADFLRHGIGQSYFVDDDMVGNFYQNLNDTFRWTNEWGERMTFGRDDVTAPLEGLFGDMYEGPFIPRSDYDYPDKLHDYGRNFRISGPDTWFSRDETTLTSLLRANITEHLSAEAGIYSVWQEQETFDVDLRTFRNSGGPAVPSIPTTFPIQKRSTQLWFANPEVNLDGTRAPSDAAVDPDYLFSLGMGEVFIFPWYLSGGSYPTVPPIEDMPARDNANYFARRFARYVWVSDSREAQSLQLRGRLAYQVEKSIFGVPGNHTFSVGANYIKDIVDFYSRSSWQDEDWLYYSVDPSNPQNSKQDVDPYYFRESIFDFSVLRYNGETVARRVDPHFTLPGLQSGADSGSGTTVAQSGLYEAQLWYRGFYGLYQGQFWENRVNLIAGIRQDQYQVKETEKLMIIDQMRASNVWQGYVNPVTPWFIGNGTGEYKSPPGIPDELDAQVREDYAVFQELNPNGTVDYNFDDYQDYTTGTFGLSWRVIDPVSVYYLYSEGIFPNTGQRDGAYNPIDAEQTVNNELGLKFDLLDGKISGTLSVYRIERDNAVYYWSLAPAPALWHGGPLAPDDPNAYYTFSPQAAGGAGSGYKENKHWPVGYGIAMDLVYDAFVEAGIEDQFPVENGRFRATAFAPWGAVDVNMGSPPLGAPYIPMQSSWVIISVDALENDPRAAVLKRAFEMGYELDREFGIPIITPSGTNELIRNNPSSQRGAYVPFSEEGEGIDGQIIWSPIPNYQVLISGSYQKRATTAFHLVDAVDSTTGINWGTPYDIWVYALGVENFSDPSRASTYNAGSMKGMDLSFVPKFSGKIWNKYTFSDGPLEGLSVGGGVQYVDSAPTTANWGKGSITYNPYPTPDTPERYIVDLFASYRWQWKSTDWSLSLRISNLLDDQMAVNKAYYTTPFDTVEKRRTRVYYNPRTWRLSLMTRF